VTRAAHSYERFGDNLLIRPKNVCLVKPDLKNDSNPFLVLRFFSYFQAKKIIRIFMVKNGINSRPKPPTFQVVT